MLIRQLMSFVALPFTVTIAIPIFIARRTGMTFIKPADGPGLTLVLIGIAILGCGVALFAACVFYFWTRGRGTLALGPAAAIRCRWSLSRRP